MGGETKYPVEYENHFTEFFFAYLASEVATIIFYLAWAGSPAIVDSDRPCFF